MTITRAEMIKKLVDKTGFYKKQIGDLLQCLEEVVLDELSNATIDEEVQIQLLTGIKCGCKIVGTRERVDPRTYEPIVVGETAKPFVKFSEDYRDKLQAAYDEKKNG